jgi:hypothetical protein
MRRLIKLFDVLYRESELDEYMIDEIEVDAGTQDLFYIARGDHISIYTCIGDKK